MGFHNLFACLVHESVECVVDLVRNLRYLDPSSTILLYNGGTDPDLLKSGFPFERYGALIHPSPRPLSWGFLHDFALDCGRFARDNFDFDTLTVVDSDQLATRPGYSEALAEFLATRPGVGMLASQGGPQPRDSSIAPVLNAHAELELWRPFLERFPDGESQFVHWSFWPATVLTRDAICDIIDFVDKDAHFNTLLKESRIWATEEILLPTLTALLGHEVVTSPFCSDYVKYRILFEGEQIEQALANVNSYWIHPVPRQYGGGRRRFIRERLCHYTKALKPTNFVQSQPESETKIALGQSLFPKIDWIKGWLSRCEMDLLVGAIEALLNEKPGSTMVEVGSYCGRATVALGMIVKLMSVDAHIYAIDPHDGVLGALDRELETVPFSRDELIRNLETAGISDIVTVLVNSSSDVVWETAIDFLLIDGLHDYFHVASDYFRFEPWLMNGSIIAFHDHADYFPGVMAFVTERLASSEYVRIGSADSLILLRRVAVQTDTIISTFSMA